VSKDLPGFVAVHLPVFYYFSYIDLKTVSSYIQIIALYSGDRMSQCRTRRCG
jgi:hypothetical protein